MDEDQYLHVLANFRGPSSYKKRSKRRPKGSSKGKSKSKKGSNKSGKSLKATGKSRGKPSKKKANCVQVRRSLHQKEFSRGFVNAEKPQYSEAEKSRLLAITECFRCRRMGHISRHCPNAPAEAGSKSSAAVGFTQDFFFRNIHREGPGPNYMFLEGASPNIPTSVGGDAGSAPDFAMEGYTDSESEIVDVATPLLPLPERAPDGT